MSADEHGPRHGCTYARCHIDPTTCPFLKSSVVTQQPAIDETCQHEWRQYWITAGLPNGFYCIYCRSITQ